MSIFRRDSQDEARRRGHHANSVTTHNAEILASLNRQQVQTTIGAITWIIDASDGLTLRGIPAIGRGVQGAIRYTLPHGSIDT